MRNKQKTSLCEIILDLYDVATGPAYNDITLDNKQLKMNGRLFFYLRMLQKIKMLIITEMVHFEFNEPHKENNYFFSLKLMVYFFKYYSIM